MLGWLVKGIWNLSSRIFAENALKSSGLTVFGTLGINIFMA
jgi:hypothetical protein